MAENKKKALMLKYQYFYNMDEDTVQLDIELSTEALNLINMVSVTNEGNAQYSHSGIVDERVKVRRFVTSTFDLSGELGHFWNAKGLGKPNRTWRMVNFMRVVDFIEKTKTLMSSLASGSAELKKKGSGAIYMSREGDNE